MYSSGAEGAFGKRLENIEGQVEELEKDLRHRTQELNRLGEIVAVLRMHDDDGK